jgi:hypothetical protein
MCLCLRKRNKNIMKYSDDTTKIIIKEPSKCVYTTAIFSFSLGVLSLLVQLLFLINLFYPFLFDGILFMFFSDFELVLIIILFLSPILALLLGISALFKIKHFPKLKGRRLASVGIVCGSEFILLAILVLIYRTFFVVYE